MRVDIEFTFKTSETTITRAIRIALTIVHSNRNENVTLSLYDPTVPLQTPLRHRNPSKSCPLVVDRERHSMRQLSARWAEVTTERSEFYLMGSFGFASPGKDDMAWSSSERPTLIVVNRAFAFTTPVTLRLYHDHRYRPGVEQLPPFETMENKAVKAVCAAIDKCQALEEKGLARCIVDWVIMGPSHSSPKEKHHWTVRGLLEGRAKLTIHAHTNGRRVRWWRNGGRLAGIDLRKRCRLLYECKD
ncbi:hypothetical protein F5887DRAFT_927524 [Amanita rubescens]|nr:hypothetical protein F5887DRAFT_927524 [Amanita rubescens]